MTTDPSTAVSATRLPTPVPARGPFVRSASAPGAALLLAALLSACGGSDDDAAAPPPPPPAAGSVSVTASLGAVFNGDVTVTCAPSGASLGSASTGSTGLVTISTSGSCAGALLVTVSGRSDGTRAGR